jgi:hypothetical protein
VNEPWVQLPGDSRFGSMVVELFQIHCHGGTIAANAALPRRIIYVWQVTGVYGQRMRIFGTISRHVVT